MPNLPGRRYFTTQELAEHWGKTIEDIEHYFKEFGLRRALRLSEQRLSIGRDEIESSRISFHGAGGAQFDHQHWLYVGDYVEVERSEAALLVGEQPGYFHPDSDKWVDGPVRRIAIEGFDGQPLEVMVDTGTVGLELGEIDLVVTLDEINRFEGEWSEVEDQEVSISGRERDTLYRVIALLAIELSKRSPKFELADKPNYLTIAESVEQHLPPGETSPKVDTIRKKISDSYRSLFSG